MLVFKITCILNDKLKKYPIHTQCFRSSWATCTLFRVTDDYRQYEVFGDGLVDNDEEIASSKNKYPIQNLRVQKP